MGVNPLSSNTIELHRERILTEIARIRDSGDARPTPLQLEALFNKAAFVSNKANVLARAISEEAEKYFIPVDPFATDIVAAVKRKSGDSNDGLKISFDLFKDAVKAAQQTRKEMEQTVILSQSITTGSALHKRIQKIRARVSIMVSSGVEPDDNLLELLLSQFITLWIAHELMKPFEAATDHIQLAQTWVQKQSGGSETQIAISILIGLAMQFIIMGLNDDAMEMYLDEACGGVYPNGHTSQSLIATARGLELNKAMKYAKMMAGLNDYEMILRYSFEFLRLTIEPGYDMWTAYVDAVQMRYTAQAIWVQAPHYSVSHAIVTQNFTGKKKTTAFTGADLEFGGSSLIFGGAPDNENERIQNAFQQTIIDSLVPMAPMSYVARAEALDAIDSNLDLVAQVLSSDFAIQVACCLGRFLGKLDPNVLKSLRAMLEGLLRAYRFDLANVLKAMMDSLGTPSFAETIALVAMKEIDQIFDKLIDNVLGLFGDDIRALLCCPLIGEMIHKVLEGIVRLEAELKGAVKIFLGKLLESIGIGSKNVTARFEQKYEERAIRKMIMILDSVIRAAEAFVACGKDNQLYSPLPDATRAAIQLPTIRINENEKTNYFTTALPRELSNGKFLPALGNEIESLVTSAVTDILGHTADRHTCGGSFNEEILNKAAAAFNKGI